MAGWTTGRPRREAFTREIREETGLTASVASLVDAWVFEVTPGKKVLVLEYACRLNGKRDVTISHEHSQHAWLALATVKREPLPKGYCGGSGGRSGSSRKREEWILLSAGDAAAGKALGRKATKAATSPRLHVPADRGGSYPFKVTNCDLTVRCARKATVYLGPHSPGESPRRGGGPPLSEGSAGRAEALRCALQVRGPSPRTKRRERTCSQLSAPLSKGRARPAPEIPFLCLHRTGRGDAVERAA